MKKKLVKWHLPGIILLAVVTVVSGCEKKPTNCEPDSYEPNNSLESSYELPSVEENSASFTARISSEDDIDFYSITATEGSHVGGIPGSSQYFKINFQLTNPSGKDYDLYIYSAEGSLFDQSTTIGDGEESIEATWQGTVGFDDSYTFGVEVRPYSGNWSCDDYTLSVTMSYSDSPW